MKKTLSMVLALALVSALCGMLFVSAEDTNLVAGKTYTISEQFRAGGAEVGWGWDENAPISYPDDNYELTDGTLPNAEDGYSAAEWMGFNNNTPAQTERGYGYVQFDLGAACDLTGIKAVSYKDKASGIACPYKVEVYVSNDGTNYESAGILEMVTEDLDAMEDKVLHNLEVAVDATAQYVEIRFTSYGWCFLGELEVYGTAAGGDVEPPVDDKPSEPSYETVEEVITIDGKLDDTGYTNAVWFDKGVWQGVKETDPILADIDIKYTTRSDADNIYLAVQVTDEVVLTTPLNPEAWDQSGATNFRLWFLGDGMETRTFYDLLWDGEKLLPHRQKVVTEELTYALGTDGGVLTLEVKIAKASLSITDSYKMMVTYSAPDFGEGENVGYNAFHMTEFVRGEDGALASGWSGNDAMYVEYKDADVVLGSYQVEVEPEIPSEDPSDDESKAPVTGDAGVLVFAVLGVVAICGAAVTIKVRG